MPNDDFIYPEVPFEPKPKRIFDLNQTKKQEFEIIKTTNHTYYKVENKIKELIENGAIIESINPLVINQHFSDSGKFSKETEILVFLLYKKGTGKNDENSM